MKKVQGSVLSLQVVKPRQGSDIQGAIHCPRCRDSPECQVLPFHPTPEKGSH